jgi:predicted nucleic acid-binding protein
VILVDANILMYAAGTDHTKKRPSIAFLERAAGGQIEAAIDAEILQEILHRYRAIRRWQDGRAVFDMARRIFPTVFPINAEVLDRTREILDEHDGLMARDALHIAVVEINDLVGICSFDRDFDLVPGLKRLDPRP